METWAPDENPLIIRHIHTRLRRGGFIAALVTTAAICLTILVVGTLIAKNSGASTPDTARGISIALLFVPGLLLLILGSQRVAMAVALERASGILESLRMTPMHPGVCLAGFVLGPPLREVLLAVSTIPFFGYCIAQGGISFVDAFQYGVILLTTALVLYLMSLIVTLSTTGLRPQRAGGAMGAMIFLIIMFIMPTFTVFSRGGPRFEVEFSFFGIRMAFFFVVLIVEAFLIAFLAIGGSRKLARDGAPPLTKRQAVCFFLLFHLLFLGLFWEWMNLTASRSVGTGGPIHPYLGLLIAQMVTDALLGLWLVNMMVPSQLAFLREMERARSRGVPVRPGSEGAGHLRWGLALAGIAALFYAIPPARLVLAGASFADLPPALLFPPILLASLLLYFGAAREYAGLRFRKGAIVVMTFVILGVWAAPLILGLIVGGVGDQRVLGAFIASPSPITGFTGAFAAVGGNPKTFAGPSPHLPALACLLFQIVLSAIFLRLLRKARARIRDRGLYRPAPKAERG